MKASKFTDAQNAFIIKQGEEGTPVAEICRKAGISQATYFNWKKKYAGLLPTEMKRLKQLEDAISISIVHPHMGDFGWEFREFPGASPDPLFNARFLHEIYTRADSNYTGRVTVPVLWDREQSTIV